MTLEVIEEHVLKCTKCELHKTKTKYVFGDGNKKAKIMFIGEAPGANEDKQGKPFVGSAGKMFDELLRSIDLNRSDIYICNILKCRPPNNRNPNQNEIISCTPYLDKQIELIKPKVICPMGNFATQFIMKKYGLQDKLSGISDLHGKEFKIKNLFDNIKIVPLYHPAVARYNIDMKNILIKDFEVLKDEYT